MKWTRGNGLRKSFPIKGEGEIVEAKAKDAMSVRHMLIIATGILVCLGPTTMIFNSWSIFMVPVSTELGVPTSAFAVSISLVFGTCVVTAPLAGKMMDRFDLRIMLTGGVLLTCAAIFGCGFLTEIWQLYIAGVMEGLAGVVLMFLMLPTMINRWFAARVGTIIGICVAMTGVGGAIWAMLGGVIIVEAGWRVAYMVLAVIALVIALPATLFFVRSYPSDVGLEPYGLQAVRADESLAAGDPSLGVSAKAAFKSPAFLLLVITMSLINGVMQVGNMLPTYVYHLGDIGAFVMEPAALIMAASTVGLCMQIGQATGKISLGILVDRNVTFAFSLALGCGLTAIACVWVGASFPMVVFAGGLLFGFFFATVDILTPGMSRAFFGQREYTKIYAPIASCINVIPVFATTGFAALADYSWDLTFAVMASILAVSTVMGLLSVKFSKDLQFTRSDAE